MGCAVPSSAQLELAVYWLARFYRHSQLLLTLPTILNVLSWKINFQVLVVGGWVVGWVELLKNKAKLSLNWVWDGALADVGILKENLSVHNLFYCAR